MRSPKLHIGVYKLDITMYSLGMTSITGMIDQMQAEAEAEVRHQLRLAAQSPPRGAGYVHQMRAEMALDELLGMHRAQQDLLGEVIEAMARKLAEIERVVVAASEAVGS
jgi:phytoene/squalene synthetase